MFVANNSLVKTKFFFPKHSTSVPVLCCGSFPSLIQEDKFAFVVGNNYFRWQGAVENALRDLDEDQDEGRSESDESEISDLG